MRQHRSHLQRIAVTLMIKKSRSFPAEVGGGWARECNSSTGRSLPVRSIVKQAMHRSAKPHGPVTLHATEDHNERA